MFCSTESEKFLSFYHFSWSQTEWQWDQVVCKAAAEVFGQGHSLPHQAAVGGKAKAPSSHGPVQQLQDQLCQELRVWSCFFKSKYIHIFSSIWLLKSYLLSWWNWIFSTKSGSDLLWHSYLWWDRKRCEGNWGMRIQLLWKIATTVMWRWRWRQPLAWLEARWVFSPASPSSAGLRSSTTSSSSSWLSEFPKLKEFRPQT